MNTKPILFSTEMVQAILAGRKTQTRRTKGLKVVNDNPDSHLFNSFSIDNDNATFKKVEGMWQGVDVPYKTGDILWVREKFRKHINCETGEFTNYSYYADMPENFHKQYPNKHKPSIHMPKEACRLFLKITNVRVERLKDITENDAIAEGVDKKGEMYYDYYSEIPQVGRDFYFKIETAKISFMGLWCKINGVDSWRSNPFVWVIEFERIEKPENF